MRAPTIPNPTRPGALRPISLAANSAPPLPNMRRFTRSQEEAARLFYERRKAAGGPATLRTTQEEGSKLKGWIVRWGPPPSQAKRNPRDVTDRAKRYRAVAHIEQRERRCIYCGKPESGKRPLMVDHIDGREENGAAENLAYACRSCNTRKGAHFARAGAGRKTRQYNPRRPAAGGRGIRSLAQFIKAISTVKGEGAQMDLFEASELLKNTPPDERSRWAKEANARRWGSRSEVPF